MSSTATKDLNFVGPLFNVDCHVRQIALSPNSKLVGVVIAASSASPTGSIKVWHRDERKFIYADENVEILNIHFGFQGNEKIVRVGTLDHRVQIHVGDIGGKEKAVVHSEEGSSRLDQVVKGRCGTLSSDGNFFCGPWNQLWTSRLTLWNVATGTVHHDVAIPSMPAIGVAISPDNLNVVFANHHSEVHIWNVHEKECKPLIGNYEGITHLRFASDGRQVVVACGREKKQEVWVVQLSSNNTVKSKTDIWNHGTVTSLACTSSHIIQAFANGCVGYFNTKDKIQTQLNCGDSSKLTTLAASQSEPFVVTSNVHGMIQLWRLDADVSFVREAAGIHSSIPITICARGQHMGAYTNKRLRVFDPTAHKVVLSYLMGVTSTIENVTISQKGVFTVTDNNQAYHDHQYSPLSVDGAIPTDPTSQQLIDMKTLTFKVAALRTFLVKNRNAPRQLLHSWCTHLDDAFCDYAVEKELPSLKEQLDGFIGQLETPGILACVPLVAAPNSTCREQLASEDVRHVASSIACSLQQVSEKISSLHTHVVGGYNQSQLQQPQLPSYLEEVYQRSLQSVKRELHNADQVLTAFDDPVTHTGPEQDTKASYIAVLRVHANLVDPESNFIHDLRSHIPQEEIKKRHTNLRSEMRELMETIHDTVRDLNTFNQAAAAFQALIAANFPATVEGVEAKLDDLRTLHDELQDTYLDCDVKVRQLRRRSMGEQEREKLESSIVALRSESAKLRAQYRREHRLALKAVTRFFPELRAKLVDEKELSVSIPFFDPSMSMDCFTNVERTFDTVERGQLDGKPVAIKHFRMDQLPTFKRECKVYSAVQSSFVGEMLCAFQDDDGLVAVMPCYEGGTADTWADRHQDDAFLTVRLLRQAADGLKCLHRAGVTHCDFKPQNVVMTGKGPEALPKLIDFGCADVAETTTVLVNRMNTQTMHALTGFTPQYVAPEVTKHLSEVMTSNNAPEAAESLRSLVTPALDIYAFGRWMSEVLKHPATWESSFELDCPSDADGVVWAKMLQALQPFAPILTGLVNRSLNEEPSHRPAVGELAEMLYHIERELLKERDAKHVEESELLECSVCSAQVKRKECVACQTTTRREAQQHESHVYCRECLAVMLEDWRSKPVQKHADVNAKVTCSYGSCPGHLQVAAVVALVPEALDHVRFVERKTAEFVAIEEVKRRYENESLEQRAIREVEERILGLRCPKCKTSCVIGDFRNECLAMTCPRCDARFCGYCEQLCGDDAHHHVTSTHSSLGLFTTREKWYRYWYSRKEAELEKYLKSLPDDVGGKVRGRFPKPS